MSGVEGASAPQIRFIEAGVTPQVKTAAEAKKYIEELNAAGKHFYAIKRGGELEIRVYTSGWANLKAWFKTDTKKEEEYFYRDARINTWLDSAIKNPSVVVKEGETYNRNRATSLERDLKAASDDTARAKLLGEATPAVRNEVVKAAISEELSQCKGDPTNMFKGKNAAILAGHKAALAEKTGPVVKGILGNKQPDKGENYDERFEKFVNETTGSILGAWAAQYPRDLPDDLKALCRELHDQAEKRWGPVEARAFLQKFICHHFIAQKPDGLNSDQNRTWGQVHKNLSNFIDGKDPHNYAHGSIGTIVNNFTMPTEPTIKSAA